MLKSARRTAAYPSAEKGRAGTGSRHRRAPADMSNGEHELLSQGVLRLGGRSEFAVHDIIANAMRLAWPADVMVVVSKSDRASLTDVFTIIKKLSAGRYHWSIQFVVNRAETRSAAESVGRRVAKVSQTFLNFNLAYGGRILQDAGLDAAVRGQRPVALRDPRSPASMCLSALAARLKVPAARRMPDGVLARQVGLVAWFPSPGDHAVAGREAGGLRTRSKDRGWIRKPVGSIPRDSCVPSHRAVHATWRGCDRP